MIFITKSDLVKNNFLWYQIHTDLVAANNSPVRDNFHWCVPWFCADVCGRAAATAVMHTATRRDN